MFEDGSCKYNNPTGFCEWWYLLKVAVYAVCCKEKKKKKKIKVAAENKLLSFNFIALLAIYCERRQIISLQLWKGVPNSVAQKYEQKVDKF